MMRPSTVSTRFSTSYFSGSVPLDSQMVVLEGAMSSFSTVRPSGTTHVDVEMTSGLVSRGDQSML